MNIKMLLKNVPTMFEHSDKNVRAEVRYKITLNIKGITSCYYKALVHTQPSIILSSYAVLCTCTTIGYNADVHTIQTTLENFFNF